MRIVQWHRGGYQADAGFINGKRIRKIFAKRKDAEIWLASREKDKTYLSLGMSSLSPAGSADALAAIEVLGGLTTLLEAARYWRISHSPEKTKALGECVTTFLEHLRIRDSRPRYLDGMRNTLELFKADVVDLPVNAYAPEMILKWLRKPEWSKQTFANRRREMSVFFNWCLKQGFVSLNPVARIPAPKIDRGKINVLTPGEAAKLLTAMMDRQRVYFAIALFAGLRPAEIDRLQWRHVSLRRGVIDVSGKTRQHRPVKIQPNLRKFLEAAPEYAPDEYVLRCDKNVMMKIATHAIGREKWPQDICRHSYGSYHLEMFGDMNETALQMGHKTTAMLFGHYRSVVDHEDAEAFWAINP